MFTTIVNTLRAVPFWTLAVVAALVFAYIDPTYRGLSLLLAAVGCYGWQQKVRIYRSLRHRLQTQGSFHAASYEGYYHTWCERMALYQATRESGFYEAAYFHGYHVLGYRLYHVFPR